MSRHEYGSIGLNAKGGSRQVFKYGLVISNQDETGAKRIIVRVDGLDDGLSNDELPTVFPLIPKTFGIRPKVNEMVLVFIQDFSNTRSDRYYVGPLVSQPQFINNSSYLTAKSGLQSGETQLAINPEKLPKSIGVYSDNDDIVIEGRNNADIVFDDNEIKIRVGKFSNEIENTVPRFNFQNPTYIQLRHNISVKNSNVTFSAASIVSDKIFLLTHENGSPRFNLSDQIKQMSDETLVEILQKAHPLPFGDTLLEFLILMKSVLLNHVHPYPGLKPVNLNGEDSISKLQSYDLTKILSKNIKIN